MLKALFIVNALLTIPFGLAALFAPEAVFAGFGLHLDPGGALIARGYGATSLGYGLAMWLLRNTDPRAARAFLVPMLVFNAAETAIQAVAGVQGTAAPAVFGTVAAHAIVSLACLVALAKKSA